MQGTASFNNGLPLLAGILVAVITFVIIAVFLSVTIQNSQREKTADLFAVIDKLADETFKILVPLNELGFDDCTEDNLRAMRSALFESAYSKQIAFYKNGLGICTSGSGILDPPITRPPPDFVTIKNNVEFWINREIELRLTGDTYNAIVIKLNRYSLLVEAGYLNRVKMDPFDWQLVFQDLDNPERIVHIRGTEGLYQQRLQKRINRASHSVYYHVECDSLHPHFCLALKTTNRALIGYYPLIVGLMSVASLAFGYISYNYVEKSMHDRVQIKSRVVRGFNTNAFYWLYQPIVNLQTNKIIGCEVLSRFRDKYGDCFPDEYLAAVRESGTTWRFTKKMIETVVPELENFKQLPDEFKVSLNIFPLDVVTGDINELALIPQVLNSRFNLAIEITEDEYLDESIARANLNKIHESGLLISIDDFGTGYSNLKQISKLNCTYLKIDRSYVMEIEETSIKSSLIPHIVNIADQLNLSIIAEGIENSKQQSVLLSLGVMFGQGWAFGKPMPAAELAALVEKQRIKGLSFA